MNKLQQKLQKILSQYDVVQKISRFDIILIAVLPIYHILFIIRNYYIYELYIRDFYSLFFLLFTVGALLTFTNNKLKELTLSSGVLTIISLVYVFYGRTGKIIEALIFASIAYACFKFSKGEDVLKSISAKAKKSSSTAPPAQTPPTAMSKTPSRFCTGCGSPIKDDDNFCTKCGEKA